MFIILSAIMIVVSLVIAGVAFNMKRRVQKQHAVPNRILKRIYILEEISTAMFVFGSMVVIGWMFLSLPIGY